MLSSAQGGRTGFAFRPPSNVGSYEYPAGTDLRPHLDDFFDIYGPSSLRSANHPQEEFTYVHTFGKAERKRLRKNLTKTGPVTPGYKINDPLVLAAQETVLYPPAHDTHAFEEAGRHPMGAPRSGASASFPCAHGVPATVHPKPLTSVPPRESVSSLTYRMPPGLNPMFLPPPPVATQNAKFSNHALKAVDPRVEAASLPPVSQVEISPLWKRNVNFATGDRYAQVAPDSGCSGHTASLQASAPAMTVQGEFAPFEKPPRVVQDIHSPFLRNTSIGDYGAPQPGIFLPYAKPLAIPTKGGIMSLEDYLRSPTTVGVEGLGL